MCGIAGILRITPPGAGPEALRHATLRPHAEAIPEEWLDILDASIKHRGPDGQGRFRDRAVRPDGSIVDVAFVHRRLSIIDLAGGAQPMVSVGSSNAAPSPAPSGEGGRVREAGGGEHAAIPPALLFHGQPNVPVTYQPITTESDSHNLCAVVFNGCIYNHRELRKELEAQGQRFVTDHSDTEVLLQGWRVWGDSLASRLDGMFGWIVWDRSLSGLSFARDFAGEKPLYGLRTEDWSVQAFSSCPAGLMSLGPLLARTQVFRFDRPEMFANWVANGYGDLILRRGFVSLSEVDPRNGESRVTQDDGVHSLSNPWAKVAKRKPPVELNEDDVDALLRRAVHSRLEADVPVGCFLSGGIDSALIAKYAVEARPDIRAFTVRMPDARLDESQAAAVTAGVLKVSHTIIDVAPRPAEDLVTLIEQLGLPFGDSSLLPTSWVCKAARQHCTVSLAGDGGDELFGGYERYRAEPILKRWGWLLRNLPAQWMRTGDLRSITDRMSRLSFAARHGGYIELLRVFSVPDVVELLGVPPLDYSTFLSAASDPLAFDFEHYLPLDLLRKSDTASMHSGLELRSPFLARSVCDAALSAPLSSLMPRGQRKGLLRHVARRYLPAEIVDRPKQGFAIPIGDWFRSDFGGMKALLLDHLGSVEPFGPPRLGIDLNRTFIQRLVDEHMDSRRDHGQRLYMLLVLSIWARWLGRLG